MEVSGRKTERDEKTTSGEEIRDLCQPCSVEGTRVAAKQFCKDCNEYICRVCSEQHRKFRFLKHHVLLDTRPVSSKTVNKQADKPTMTCPTHTDKLVEFYCPEHNSTSCSVCAVLSHRPCKIDYIPDISVNFKDSEKYKQLEDELKQMANKADFVIKETEKSLKQTEVNSRATIAEIRKTVHKLEQYLKQKEHELISAVENMCQEDLIQLKEIIIDTGNVKSEINDMHEKLEILNNNCSDLFTSSIEMLKHTHQLQKAINTSSINNQSQFYVFSEGKMCADLSISDALGTIQRRKLQEERSAQVVPPSRSKSSETASSPVVSVSLETGNVFRLADVNVKSAQDKLNCIITGITILQPNTLLLTDRTNECVKSVDIKTNKVKSYLQLSSLPWGISTLGPHQAAITIPDRQEIPIISTIPILATVRTIAVKGQCWGIDATSDTMIISYKNPSKVEVMDHSGSVLNIISKDKRGSTLFKCPYYLCVTADNVMYVSDSGTQAIIKLSLSDEMLYTYSDSGLRRPHGMALCSDRSLLVCGCESNNIQLVSSSGSKIRTLLDEQDGIDSPLSVCHCAEVNRIYVECSKWTSGTSNKLKVYQLE